MSSQPDAQSAARGRGPHTDAGKNAVRLNAVRHGIVTSVIPLPQEDATAWEEFQRRVIDDLAPVGAVEHELARRVAELFWRLRRVAPYEYDLAATARERISSGMTTGSEKERPDSIEKLEAQLSGLHEAIDALTTGLSANRLSSPAAAALKCALVDLDADPHVVYGKDTSGWGAKRISAAVATIAREHSTTDDDATAKVLEELQVQVDHGVRNLMLLQQEEDRRLRERALPPEQALTNLSKYEAHLNRQLYQALHEIEALQGRRRGQPVPLARVQVSAGG